MGLVLVPALVAVRWVSDVFEESDRLYERRLAEADEIKTEEDLVRAINATPDRLQLLRLLESRDMLASES